MPPPPPASRLPPPFSRLLSPVSRLRLLTPVPFPLSLFPSLTPALYPLSSILYLLSSFLVLNLLPGCSRRETSADTARQSRTLLIGNGAEPGSLDPHLAAILSDQIIVNALFEGLTLLDESTTTPLPAAAGSWESSVDGLTWTFRLRENLRWSNGDPLTADDFVQSWRRALRPSVAADNAWYLFALRNAEAFNAGRVTDPAAVGVTAPDPRTLVLTLERPTPYLPALVSLPAWFPIHPRSLAESGALERRDASWTRPGKLVSNGAFSLAKWVPNDRIVLAKNPHHRDTPATALDRLVFRPIENPDVEERNFRAGQLHVTFNLPVTKVAAWRTDDPTRLRVDPILQSNFLRFNTTRPPLDDPRIRRALSLAIDRDELARSVLQSSRPPARSFTPPSTGAYTARAAVATDVATARRLLEQAGFTGGTGLPVIDIQCRNDELMPRLAEALQAIWARELGVRTTISQLEQKTWIQNQQSLNYGISTAAWTADYPDAVNFLGLLAGDSSYNWTGWKHAPYDRLLEQAATTADPTARLELLQQAEAMLLAEAPIAPLHFGAQTYLIDPAIRGWDPAPLVFRRYQKVSFAADD